MVFPGRGEPRVRARPSEYGLRAGITFRRLSALTIALGRFWLPANCRSRHLTTPLRIGGIVCRTSRLAPLTEPFPYERRRSSSAPARHRFRPRGGYPQIHRFYDVCLLS